MGNETDAADRLLSLCIILLYHYVGKNRSGKRIQNPKEQPPRALPECTSAPGAAASEELVLSTV